MCGTRIHKRLFKERKYHRCVLMVTPFFECVLKNEFIEKYTGKIKMSCGTPTSVDDALMFLYGKELTLNEKNIEVMIDLAEFFMIPNLKSACVSWLGKQPFSEENCMSWLQLSTKYGFALPNCTEYIESHLHEVLLQKSSITLTFESICYFFTEKKFCYFQMEDRLRFLVRWYAAQPEKREDWAEKLLESIAFEDITMSCLNEMKCDPLVEKLLRNVNGGLEDTHELTNVLICKIYDTLLCFDLARDTWFKIKSTVPLFRGTERIADTKPDVSELYIAQCDNIRRQLHNVNMQTDEIKTYEIVKNANDAVPMSDNFHFENNVCVVWNTKHVETKMSDQAASSLNERIEKLRLLALLGPIDERLLSQLLFQSSSSSYEYRNTTLVLIGIISGEKVEMVPQFSVADSEISSVTVNKDSVIALIPNSKTFVLVYDTASCTMNNVELKTKHDDEIFPAENGFVIYNNERCITIMRISDPALSETYEVKEYVLGDSRERTSCFTGIFDPPKIHFYRNNTWFRYFFESNDSEYHFQCVEQSKVEELNVVWKNLSLPKESPFCSSLTLGKTVHFIRLPRRLLRCHVDCPHCVAGKRRSTAERTSVYYDFDLYCRNDDSDSDDHSIVSYGMDDNDDYYF